MKTKTLLPLVVGGLLLGVIEPAQSFQLSPNGTLAEREMAKKYGVTYRASIPLANFAVHNFSESTHETLTQKIYGCDGNWGECKDPDLEYAGAYVIAGVRWNDDPVFMPSAEDAKTSGCKGQYSVGFISQTRCWINLFEKAELESAARPAAYQGTGNYIARSHFGDLQFLHAMASLDEVPAEQTKREIMMWAEFVWGVADGTYSGSTYLKDITIEGWPRYFDNGQTVQDLFSVGRPWLRSNLNQVAFGSLLHVVEDSFAQGHVQRRDEVMGDKCLAGTESVQGRIEEFHSYAGQDHGKHKESDANAAARHMLMTREPDVVDAGKKLRGYIADKKNWQDVRPYLDECVFALARQTSVSSAGTLYRPD